MSLTGFLIALKSLTKKTLASKKLLKNDYFLNGKPQGWA